MALTRKMLKAMGIEDEKIDQIIEAHADTVDSLKDERDSYKKDAEKVESLEKKINELESNAESNENGDWQKKYEEEHSNFEKFKKETAEEKINLTKSNLYRKMLVEIGIDEKRIDSILKITDLSSVNLGEDGSLDGLDELKKTAESEWEGFIVKERMKGADVENPPHNDKDMTKEEFDKLPLADKMAYANEHPAEWAKFNE